MLYLNYLYFLFRVLDLYIGKPFLPNERRLRLGYSKEYEASTQGFRSPYIHTTHCGNKCNDQN